MGSDSDKLLYPKKEKKHRLEKNEKAFVRLHSDLVGSCGSRASRAMIFK